MRMAQRGNECPEVLRALARRRFGVARAAGCDVVPYATNHSCDSADFPEDESDE